MKKNNFERKFFLKFLGLLFSVVPVLLAVLFYFPVWREEGGGKLISGGALLLILLSILPLFRYIKSIIRTPSVHTLWFISFLLFFSLSKIAEEMTVISFIGFTSNLIGAFFFKLGDRANTGEENEG